MDTEYIEDIIWKITHIVFGQVSHQECWYTSTEAGKHICKTENST